MKVFVVEDGNQKRSIMAVRRLPRVVEIRRIQTVSRTVPPSRTVDNAPLSNTNVSDTPSVVNIFSWSNSVYSRVYTIWIFLTFFITGWQQGNDVAGQTYLLLLQLFWFCRKVFSFRIPNPFLKVEWAFSDNITSHQVRIHSTMSWCEKWEALSLSRLMVSSGNNLSSLELPGCDRNPSCS